MRELEGAFVGAPMGWRGEGVLGVMVSKREATRGVREAMGRSRWPLVWMGVETEDADGVKDGEGVEGDEDGYREGRGVVRQVLWNEKAKRYGLEGIDVTTRFGKDGREKELVLMWMGEVLKGLDDAVD